MKFQKSKIAIIMILIMALVGSFGCSKVEQPTTEQPTTEQPSTEQPAEEKLAGTINIDGSSTVFPITEAVVEEFNMENSDVKIPVGVSGSGGGFKKFVVNEIDIADASRPIKDAEAETAKGNGIDFVELTVAYDGLSVLVNPENTWVESMTVEELNMMWKADSTVKMWSDIRPEWPSEDIVFYAPGTDSGTFEYFTEEINGEAGSIRPDYTGSEDDNVLVQGIAGDKNAIGFFGYAYYAENTDKLKAVKVDSGNGPVEPTFDTIKDGSYSPLSRPLFIYVNKEALTRPEVKAFVTYYLEVAKDLVGEVGYVALPDSEYEAGLSMIQ
jgi:phosphate transport system substrate-binding protein